MSLVSWSTKILRRPVQTLDELAVSLDALGFLLHRKAPLLIVTPNNMCTSFAATYSAGRGPWLREKRGMAVRTGKH